jgi:hypothetical protein
MSLATAVADDEADHRVGVRMGRKYSVNPVLNVPPFMASWTQPMTTIHQP